MSADLYAVIGYVVLMVIIAQVGDVISRRVGGWSKHG